MECMRQYISELLDFIADMHTLTKLKVSPVLQFCLNIHIISMTLLLLQIYSTEPYEGLLSAAA